MQMAKRTSAELINTITFHIFSFSARGYMQMETRLPLLMETTITINGNIIIANGNTIIFPNL